MMQWARPLLSVVFDGINDTTDYELRQLFPAIEGIQKYFRFQLMLDEDMENLDNIEKRNIRALKLSAEALIRDKNETINYLCEQLLK